MKNVTSLGWKNVVTLREEQGTTMNMYCFGNKKIMFILIKNKKTDAAWINVTDLQIYGKLSW